MSLILTRTQNMRAAYEGKYDHNELRASRYGALDHFQIETNNPAGIITADLKEKAARSIGSTLQVPVIDYDGGISIGNTRSVTIADSENTSKLVTISFSTYTFGFTIVPALFMNNEISMQQDFNRKLEKYIYKLAETLDSACVAALEAAKTQVYAETLDYTVSGNTLQVPLASQDQVIGDIDPILNANDFYGPIHVIGNTGLQSIIRKLSEQGLYNDKNKVIQFQDKVLHWTNRLTNGTGMKATAYALSGSQVGMIARFEREALLGTKMADGTAWDIDNLPILNLPIGTYYYESKGDFSAIAGAASADMDRVRKEHYGFAVDIAILTAYNSDAATYASPIIKLEIANAPAQ